LSSADGFPGLSQDHYSNNNETERIVEREKEKKMEVKTFGVIGAGQMGNGIAQVAATSGLNVIMMDISEEFVQRGVKAIDRFLTRSVEKGKLSVDEKAAILGRITPVTDIKAMVDADFVVEAATEREDLKFKIFRDLDVICRPDVILSTNTSSIPIGRIAAQTKRPEKVIGMHFMNPVPIMKLVEVIRGIATSDETFQLTWALSEKFGKTPAQANDFPGFIANRILMPMINEAIFTLYHGVGKREDIDTVMKLGMNHPMGPLALADLIGLDTCLAIMETLYDGFKDSKYRPCPLLRKYVEAGWLGKKTGRGFYEYN
jgi:3-hydroxybutyryl-CoA dehydrogenase